MTTSVGGTTLNITLTDEIEKGHNSFSDQCQCPAGNVIGQIKPGSSQTFDHRTGRRNGTDLLCQYDQAKCSADSDFQGLGTTSRVTIVQDRFAFPIGHGEREHGAFADSKVPDCHLWRSWKCGDDLQPRQPENLLKRRVGGTASAYLLEHGVGNDDFGYSRAQQVELADFG